MHCAHIVLFPWDNSYNTSIIMKSILVVAMLVLQLSISEPSVCYSHPPPLDLSSLPVKVNSAYTFKIQNYPSPVTLARN